MLKLFCDLIALMLYQNILKDLIFTKTVKTIKLEAVWGKLKAKKYFQRQPLKTYLRLTLVSMLNIALREKFYFCFSRIFL